MGTQTRPRVSNSDLQSTVLGLVSAVEKLTADNEEIKTMLRALDTRMRELERKEDMCHPVIENRVEHMKRELDQHDQKLVDLSQVMVRLEQSYRLLMWLIGIVGSTVVIWIVQQLLHVVR